MSAEQRSVLDRLLREGPLDLCGDLEVQRPILDHIMTATPLAQDLVCTPGRLGGVPVVTIELAGGERDTVILYLHGGAYALGSAAAGAGLASELARRGGARAVSVDYRLAPEHPYPAALDDAVAVYRALLDDGVLSEQLALVGESAGAGLAVATLLTLGALGLPQPAAAVLLSPWADLT